MLVKNTRHCPFGHYVRNHNTTVGWKISLPCFAVVAFSEYMCVRGNMIANYTLGGSKAHQDSSSDWFMC